jgi:tRNA (cytosine34-C5)-methyltransferase
MNPSENESVVAAVLKKFQGQLELVDVSGELPKLKRMPGLHTWKVAIETLHPTPYTLYPGRLLSKP